MYHGEQTGDYQEAFDYLEKNFRELQFDKVKMHDLSKLIDTRMVDEQELERSIDEQVNRLYNEIRVCAFQFNLCVIFSLQFENFNDKSSKKIKIFLLDWEYYLLIFDLRKRKNDHV